MIIRLKPTSEILARRGLDKKGKVQKIVDSEVLRYSDPYVPMLSSTLKKSGVLSTDLGSGEVQYNTPYARYQYYGKVMVGRAPKKVIDKNLQYGDAPKRGALWFERMKAAHKDNILRAAAKAGGGHV